MIDEGVPTATHYDRLGVTASASTEEIRTAYRALAQRLHPDRAGSATAAEQALAERRMREINESWHVLSDPGRRRAYDDQRLSGRVGAAPRARPSRSSATAPVPVSGDDDLVDVLPPMTALAAGLFRHLPWVVLVLVFGAIFVLSAYAGSKPGVEPAPPPTAVVGDCLDVSVGPTTSIVPCAGPHELRIVERVVSPTECPAGSEARRLAADGRYDCVVSN